MKQIEKYGRLIAGQSIVNYTPLIRNDFAYNKSSTKAFPEGYIARFEGEDLGAVPNSIFTCFRLKEGIADPGFLDSQFQGNLHGRWLRTRLSVGARAHGSLNVSDRDVLEIPVPLPEGLTSISEQTKISSCLTSLGELIAEEERKLEALLKHKRGLLQQLFPRPERTENGKTIPAETTPRLRFSKFREAGPWSLVPLSKSLQEHKLKSDGISAVHSVSVSVGLVDQVQHLGRSFSATDTSSYNLVLPMDVVYTKSPTGQFPYGIVKQSRLRTNALVSPLYGVFKPAQPSIGYLIEAFFESPSRAAAFLAPISKKGAKNTIQITNSIFLSGPMALPEDPEEADAIADCLICLDTLIAAQAKKAELLKFHKRGLLQSMFPTTETK